MTSRHHAPAGALPSSEANALPDAAGLAGAAGRVRAEGRSLMPREHGAYGQLLLPLAAALAAVRPSAVTAAVAGAAVTTFLMHEPLLILLGVRGTRAKREDQARARSALMWLGLGTALAVSVAFALSTGLARAALAVPFALGAVVIGFVIAKRERTDAGEIVAGSALASWTLPVLLAAGVPIHLAVPAWLAWAAGFAAQTLVVRGVLASARRGADAPKVSLGLRAGAAVAIFALAASGRVLGAMPTAALVALAPLCGAAVILAVARPTPKRVRVVGWTLVATSVLAAVLLAATLPV